MKDSSRNYRDRIADEAADWYARLQDQDASVADREAFTQWLSASAQHVQEYLAIAALHSDLSGLKATQSQDGLLEIARISQPQNVVPFTRSMQEASGGLPSPKHSRLRKVHALAAAAAIALAAIGALWLTQHPNTATYTTQRGEQKSITLPDGSVVTLNAISTLRLDFTPRSRDLRLLTGEALFDVAKNPQRPFCVFTGDTVIRAVGTRFNVYHRERATTVTVVEGAVAIATPEKPDVIVRSGQRARVEPASHAVALAAVNTEIDTAWRERRLIFESRPLADVVAEFNRYNETRLVIDDPSLASTEVSGNFYANDPGSFTLFLEQARLAERQDRPDGTIRLRPARKVVVDSSR